MKSAYYSAISFIDYNNGRLLGYMEENGLLDNTLIVFASDHGELLGDYFSVGKRCFLDSAARVPLILCDPDLPQGKVCDRPVSLVDIMPTLLQAVGLKPEEDYSGRSLADIALGRERREMVFGQFSYGATGMYMAVTDRLKYIYSAPDRKEWLLFDLRTDPKKRATACICRCTRNRRCE